MIVEHAELRYQGKVIFERLVMSAKFKRVPKLFVEDEACFLFLTKGAFRFRTPTNLLIFQEGDGMLSKCGNYFIENIAINEESGHEVISVVGAFFYPAVVKHFFQTDLSIHAFQKTFDTVKIDIEPLMRSFMDSINYLLDNPTLADENLITTKLKELLLLLSKSEKADSVSTFVHSLFVAHEYNFGEIIRQNLYANLSMDEWARLCNMSVATFKRKFSEFYDQTPARYIQTKKLEKSVQLLAYKSKPVSEIAYECGFENLSTFDRVFKKQFGKTPREYRLSLTDN